MIYKPEVVSANIVALGAFNPAIYTPDWLLSNGLIGEGEAESIRQSQNIVISHQITVLEGLTFILQVEEEKFQLTCKGVVTPALRDLAAGVFELLPHTPLTALGLNFDTLFRFFDTAAYHRVGDALAPKDIWAKIYPKEEHALGLQNLVVKVQAGSRDEGPNTRDCKNFSVQPGVTDYPSIRFAYNDHRDIAERAVHGRLQAEVAAEVLRSDWELAWLESTKAVADILEFATVEI